MDSWYLPYRAILANSWEDAQIDYNVRSKTPAKLIAVAKSFFPMFSRSFKKIIDNITMRITLVRLITATCDEFGAVCRAIKNVTPLIAYKTQNMHDFTKVAGENIVNIFTAERGRIT